MYPHYPFPASSSPLLVLVSLYTPGRIINQQQQHQKKKSYQQHVRGQHSQDGVLPRRPPIQPPSPVAMRSRPIRVIRPTDLPRGGRALAELRRNDARDARSVPKRPGPRLVVLCLQETYGVEGGAE